MSLDPKEIFGDIGRKNTQAQRRRRKSTEHVVPERQDAYATELQRMMRYQRDKLDKEAQHGPVRTIVKDGKPFTIG